MAGNVGSMSSPIFVLRVVEGPALGRQALLASTLDVGRGAAGLDLEDPYASRPHARFHVVGNRVAVDDLGSRRGTVVGGQRIAGPTPLAPGDEVALGSTRLVVLELDPAAVRQGAQTKPRTTRLVSSSGAVYPLGRDGEIVVGRMSGQADVIVAHRTVSRRHCRVRSVEGQAVVEPLQSRSPTSVNGVAVDQPRPLAPGDELRFGAAPDRLRLEDGDGSTGAPTDVAPVQLSVRLEDDDSPWSVEIDAPPTVTTGVVLDAVARYLGLADKPWSGHDTMAPGSWWAYQAGAGMLLARATPWWATSLRRGDSIVLAPGRSDTLDLPPLAAPPELTAPLPRRVAVNQLPRTVRPPAAARPMLPEIPEGTSFRGRGVMWQVGAGLVSAMGGAAMGILFGNWLFPLIFVTIGVVTIGASVLGEQSRRRFRLRDFRARLEALDQELSAARLAQGTALRDVAPPPDALLGWVDGPAPRLWERRLGDEDFLAARLGTTSLPSLLEMDDTWRRSQSPVAGELGEVLDRHRILEDVPFVVQRQDAPVVGLIGDRALVEGLARSLVVQAVTLHSPQELGLVLLSGDRSWEWARWLPHVEAGTTAGLSWDSPSARALATAVDAELTAQVEATRARAVAGRPLLIVVDVSAGRLPEVRRLTALAAAGPSQVVVLAEHSRQLPPEVVLEVDCEPGAATLRGPHLPDAVTRIRPEYVDVADAATSTATLARYQDPRASTGGHSMGGGLLGLLEAGSPDRVDAARFWSTRPDPALRVPVGVRDDGAPLLVGFRENGPHALLAGMTGSGKSVFLQSLLAALAVTHSPEQLNLFLIDYKGGSAFAQLGQLPHTVGVVTDLEGDRSLTVRALISLDAELTRRKELFSAAGNVESLIEYERLPPDGREPLPSLVVVIDEYAALASDPENSEAVDRLKQVAIQGRSLGVHMLLAMQSPQGVVSPAISKNTNIWICLKVLEPSESETVVGKPDAANIDDGQAGRGYFRLGGGDQVVGFQTAMVTGGTAGGSAAVVVRPFGDDRPPVTTVADERGEGRDQPLRQLCARLIDEAGRLGVPPQRKLWLPTLPAMLSAADLPDDRPASASRLEVRVGLADFPEQQAQRTSWLDVSDVGNALVIGEFGSGKTTTLNHLALDLAEQRSPADLHLYAIDAGAGALGGLTRLPHVAAVVGSDDLERLGRLFQRLTTVADQRRERLAAESTGSWLRWRETASSPQPWIVLLIDDFPVLKENIEGYQYGRLLEQLTSLLQGGPQVGIHVVLATTQRTDLRGAVINLFGGRLVLRQSDPADYDLGGLRGVTAREHDPVPGRALVAGRNHAEVQVLYPSEERFTGVGERWVDVDPAALPSPIRRLPKEVSVAELQAEPLTAGADRTLLGVGGDELQPVFFDHARAGPHLPVLGEDLSGRSTVLRTCLETASASDPAARFAVVLCRQSPLRGLQGDPRVALMAGSADEAPGVLEAVALDESISHVLIDDAELLPPVAAPTLEALLRTARERGLRTVISARASDFARLYEGWTRYLLSLKIGLLMMPTPDMGGLVDVRLPKDAPTMVPGRAYLAVRGEVTQLQVAQP